MRLLTKKQEEALREGAYNEALADFRASARPNPPNPPAPDIARNVQSLERFITELRARYLNEPTEEIRKALQTAQSELRAIFTNTEVYQYPE